MPPAPERPALVRVIGRHDLAAAVVNGIIGSGVFGLPGTIAARAGTWSPLACLLAGAGTLLVVLCFAEVASRFREAGGPYLYTRAAFGPLAGFEAGWLTFWIRVTAVAANLNVFAQYLAQLLPAAASPAGRAAVIVLLTLLITLVNLAGVRQATFSVNVFTVAKLLPLLALLAWGLVVFEPATFRAQAVAQVDWAQAVLLLVFAYGGFEAPLIPAGEARDPRRDSAFALLSALGLVTAVYLLLQVALLGLVPHLGGSKAPVADGFAALLGPPGLALASLAAMVSVYGYATGNALQTPRLLYAMARARELPEVLGRVHPRFRTPHVAIAAYALATGALALHGSFEWNATLSAVVRLITYAATCGALIVLRRKPRAEAAGFVAPAGTLVAVGGLLFCAWLLSTRSLAQGGALLVLSVAGALLWLAGRRRATEPAP